MPVFSNPSSQYKYKRCLWIYILLKLQVSKALTSTISWKQITREAAAWSFLYLPSWTSTRLMQTQVWPVLRYFPASCNPPSQRSIFMPRERRHIWTKPILPSQTYNLDQELKRVSPSQHTRSHQTKLIRKHWVRCGIQTELTVPFTATSRLASSKIMHGAFPPSSREICTTITIPVNLQLKVITVWGIFFTKILYWTSDVYQQKDLGKDLNPPF